MFFSKALLHATYKDGKPGKLTEEHQKAEHHRFKTQYLFKDKKIPKGPYVARLIQHFFIIKTIETQLQNLSTEGKSEISPFFALSYINQLWRTTAIQKDLEQLGVNIDTIEESNIVLATKNYLKDIEKLTPKNLLAHFLFHVAGFMHGGNIIKTKYIEPSNRIPGYYQISVNQYDFSKAAAKLPNGKSSLDVYNNMMSQVDKISLTEEEGEEIIEQGKNVYKTMANIYDDLCNIYFKQPTITSLITCIGMYMVVIAMILKVMTTYFNSPINTSPSPK
ncbi:biliverdin-producing heme oxygenase [Legionella sp. CNM-1927-20]|uniref:biliverdin-producing heme oxygenase n=1 Tax=Legionella sp. CNM-1927-20 TaxID=3422221 RepID=UPI00403AF9A3